MALTDAQREVVFEILDVPSFDRVGIMVDVDHLATFAIDYGDLSKRTSVFIDGVLNLIAAQYTAGNTAKEDRLVDLIEKWEKIDTDPSRQDAGNIGSLSGINDDPDSERKIIRGRVERIIGLREWNERRTVMRSPAISFGQVIAGSVLLVCLVALGCAMPGSKTTKSQSASASVHEKMAVNTEATITVSPDGGTSATLPTGMPGEVKVTRTDNTKRDATVNAKSSELFIVEELRQLDWRVYAIAFAFLAAGVVVALVLKQYVLGASLSFIGIAGAALFSAIETHPLVCLGFVAFVLAGLLSGLLYYAWQHRKAILTAEAQAKLKDDYEGAITKIEGLANSGVEWAEKAWASIHAHLWNTPDTTPKPPNA